MKIKQLLSGLAIGLAFSSVSFANDINSSWNVGALKAQTVLSTTDDLTIGTQYIGYKSRHSHKYHKGFRHHKSYKHHSPHRFKKFKKKFKHHKHGKHYRKPYSRKHHYEAYKHYKGYYS